MAWFLPGRFGPESSSGRSRWHRTPRPVASSPRPAGCAAWPSQNPTGGATDAARALRYRAGLLETRLVDPLWRETAAGLLRLLQAA